VNHLNCKLYYQQLHLKYLCNLARYWLQAVWGWHDSVETCSSVIICEIIVHFLVIVQNWLQAVWGWHDSVETCSSVIICEIIVHFLVIIQNWLQAVWGWHDSVETCSSVIICEIIVHLQITNYSQQDATFLEFIYFYRRYTGFRRFLRPSSGAHTYEYKFRYCQTILLPAATV